jgi:hypothetical protein
MVVSGSVQGTRGRLDVSEPSVRVQLDVDEARDLIGQLGRVTPAYFIGQEYRA